jgi:hypothetical protein
MKFSKKELISSLLISSVILMSMSSSYNEDPDGKAGHNGSPGEQTCAKSTCHTSFTVNSGPGSVSISAPGMTNWQYVPGQTYTINVTVSQSSVPLFGFGFEALLASGANAGTLTAGTDSNPQNATVMGNSRRTITHDEDSGLVTGSKTWSFTWLAPANGAAVTFYAAGNAANNSSSDSGDYIYTTSQAVSAVIVPNAPTIVANGETNLCNGASVNLSVTAQSGVTFTWFDANNAQVATGTSFTTTLAGCYHVEATASGGDVSSLNTICVTASSPDASFFGIADEYCSDDDAVAVNFNTEGGTLTGFGIVGNSFDPQLAGPGTHTIMYAVQSENGCTAAQTKTVVVNESVSAVFTLSDDNVCVDAELVQLSSQESGGQFSGISVSGNVFNPSIGPGEYTITYVVGTGSCLTSSENTITVNALPEALFTGINPEYCSNADAVTLNTTSLNPVFSGDGVSGNSFNPASAGAGEHVITMFVTDENNCSASSTQNVVVNQEVNPFFALNQTTFCVNDEPAFFMAMNPGGVYSINGEAIPNFDPEMGTGLYSVQYMVGEGSCEVFSMIDVTVLAIDDPTFTGLEAGYCSLADAVQLMPATPGGTFSGSGISADSFAPSTALIGENLITHNLIAENGCNSSSTVSVFVYENADSDFSGLESNYCENELPSSLIPASAGGTFAGVGIVDGAFDPALAGPGTHEITYAVDFVGCSSSTSVTTTVFAVPELTVSGLNASYCLDDPSAVMIPSLGTALLTVDGVELNTFDPALAGVGIHSVTCTNIDENNCTVQWSSEVEVIGLPSDVVVQGDVAVGAYRKEQTTNGSIVSKTILRWMARQNNILYRHSTVFMP